MEPKSCQPCCNFNLFLCVLNNYFPCLKHCYINISGHFKAIFFFIRPEKKRKKVGRYLIQLVLR